MEEIKQFILKSLPDIKDDVITVVVETLSKCGVTGVGDFQYVEECDLEATTLTKIQI
jgi:hypothetical protein